MSLLLCKITSAVPPLAIFLVFAGIGIFLLRKSLAEDYKNGWLMQKSFKTWNVFERPKNLIGIVFLFVPIVFFSVCKGL